jgi:hypothetical protein
MPEAVNVILDFKAVYLWCDSPEIFAGTIGGQALRFGKCEVIC